jgi:hypothetical protein
MDHVIIFAFETIINNQHATPEKKIQILSSCIEFGIDINHGDSMLLFSAINNNDYNLVCFLNDNGINLRARNDRAIIDACNIGTITISRVEKDSENKLNIIKLLLSNGIDLHIQNNKAIKKLCKYNTCFDGITDIVKILVEYGFNALARDNLLLKKACEYNDIKLATYLVSIGANLNYPDIFTHKTSIDLCKLLLENGYDPNTIHDKSCLLEKSINNIDKCKLLFEYGTNITYCYNIIGGEYDFLKYISFKPATKKQLIDLFLIHGLDIANIVQQKIEK